MKKLMLIALLSVPLMIMAQESPVSPFFEKYAGKEGFTTVNISQKLFSMFASLSIDEELDQFDELIAELEGIQILIYEENAANSKKYFDEAWDQIPMNHYEELMTVKSDEENVRFLIHEGKDGMIKELLMLVNSEDEFVFISILGNIDLEKISKLSKSMNLDGMEHLDKMEENGTDDK